MSVQEAIHITNPQTDALAFKVMQFVDDTYFQSLINFNYYTIILIRNGSGQMTTDVSRYGFGNNCLARFTIYQPFRIHTEGPICGVMLQFHPDFFWSHKYENELPCKQALFRDIGEIPLLKLDEKEMQLLLHPLEQLLNEARAARIGRYDAVISWTKIFMIHASRIKVEKKGVSQAAATGAPYLIQQLIHAIEEHYPKKHQPADYAALLNVTVRSLNRAVRQHLKKTVGVMISERLVAQAKHELFLTDKPVKHIAAELGFGDMAYFGRFFRKHAGVSPLHYRERIRSRKSPPISDKDHGSVISENPMQKN